MKKQLSTNLPEAHLLQATFDSICLQIISVDPEGEGIASIRPQSLIDMMKVSSSTIFYYHILLRAHLLQHHKPLSSCRHLASVLIYVAER